MLAHLAEHAMAGLQRAGGKGDAAIEIVFPAEPVAEGHTATSVREDVASTPNRVVAIVTGDEHAAASLARRVEEAVRGELHRICRAAIDEVFQEMGDRTRLYQQAEAQADDTLELFWAIEPFAENQSFEKARTRLEARLAAVKNNRPYTAFLQTGLVCTVCGERDALYDHPPGTQTSHQNETQAGSDEKTAPPTLLSHKELKQALRHTWNQRNQHLRRYRGGEEGEGRIKDGEFLCGLCLSKRISRDYFRREKKARRHSFGSFESTTHLAKAYDKGQTYYAIISMDGDDMGKWLSGREEEQQRQGPHDSLARYRAFSERLTRFARETVPACVQQFDGELVYAGGDDVLAFAPVEKALPLAEALRRAFSDRKTGLGPRATASMGIVIAHYKAPLYNILNWAREMESAAKSYVHIDGKTRKDAFALAYLPRGGERRFAILPWSIGHDGQSAGGSELPIKAVQHLIEQLGKKVSSTFVYTFGQIFMPLMGSKPEGHKLQIFPGNSRKNETLIRLELERLLRRALKDSQSEHYARQFARNLTALYRVVPSTQQFIHLLEMIRNVEVKPHDSRVDAAR